MTIIQTYEDYFLNTPGLIVLFVGAILATGFITSLYYEINEHENFKIACICIAVVLVVVGIVMSTSSTTYHQIIVNDETPFSTVQQQYEIIEQKGISYIVKEIGGE